MTPRFRTLDPGVYVFDFDSPDLKSRDSMRFFGIASNTQLTTKQIGDDLLIWAFDLDSLSPIPNGPIVIYNSEGEVIDGGTTDAHGLVKIQNISAGTIHITMNEPEHPQFGLLSIVVEENFNKSGTILTSAEFLLDRPTYYPGETINYLIYPGENINEDLSVNLVYTYQGQSNVIEETFIAAKPGIGLQGSFHIPESLPLGSYKIDLEGYEIDHPINVGEKKSSEVTIDITFAQDIYEFGEEIIGEFSIQVAEIIPVPGQKVDWIASISPSALNFSGNCITDETGYCSFSISPEALSSLSDQETYQLQITASSDGLSTSGSNSCSISPAKFAVNIQPETWLGQAGEIYGVEIIAFMVNQEVFPSVDLDARFEKINFIDVPTFIDGKEIITREVHGTQIASTAFSTDENGYARLTFTPPDTGVYRIIVEKGKFNQESWFYVNGIQSGEWLEEGQELITIADKETALPGETVQVFLPNPFASTTTVLVTIQNQSEYRYQTVTMEEESGKIIDLAIKESDIPTIQISMTFLGIEADGRVGIRESELEIIVEEQYPKLSITSELEITKEDKALFRISVTDAADLPVQAAFSLLVLPKDWISQQPSPTVFFQENFSPSFDTTVDNSLNGYIRQLNWSVTQPETDSPTNFDLNTMKSIPFTNLDTTFLTNLSTSVEGTSFIEFPFSPENTDYQYYVVAVDDNGVTGYQQDEVSLKEDKESSIRKENTLTFSNVLASPGQEFISLPIPFENAIQKWKVELFGNDLTAIQSFTNQPWGDKQQPGSIASAMLYTYASNSLNANNLSIAPYVSLLESTQNQDGGWGFLPNELSDMKLTNFISFALFESGGVSIMDDENLTRLTGYLQNSIAVELTPSVLNRYSLQSITLEYQDLASILAQDTSSSISDQIFLILALAQQSNTESNQADILSSVLTNLLYDEFGAYLPGDKTEELWGSDESITALALFTLGQIQPQSSLIPELRSWLIHQGLTTNLVSNPVAYSLTLLALQRTSYSAAVNGDFEIQVEIDTENSIRMNASEITSQSFSNSYEIDALSPTISIIHGEGQGNLYYRITSATPTNLAIANGIELSQTFYSIGKSCRPGNCVTESKFSLPTKSKLIETHLVLTVVEDLQHVVISMPESETYLIHHSSEVFSKLLPPLESPLAYGINLDTFTTSRVDGKMQLYATSLPSGTYEIVYYIEPLNEGVINLEPINAYHLFSDVLYGMTEALPLDITIEKSDE